MIVFLWIVFFLPITNQHNELHHGGEFKEGAAETAVLPLGTFVNKCFHLIGKDLKAESAH
jgi:hypothetical protein